MIEDQNHFGRLQARLQKGEILSPSEIRDFKFLVNRWITTYKKLGNDYQIARLKKCLKLLEKSRKKRTRSSANSAAKTRAKKDTKPQL